MTETDGRDHRARGPLAAGERVLLIDAKDRRYLVRLKVGGSFQSHAGVLDHDELIGLPEGSRVPARRREGQEGALRHYLVLRPTLADVVLKMPRGAQVIYPKDLGAILLGADIFPGARVLEAGVGSGALTMTLLRAGARVTGYEIRADFAADAVRNVTEHLGPGVLQAGEVAPGGGVAPADRGGTDGPALRIEERDVYEGIDEVGLDRIVLDLPEPWRVLPHASRALAPGGILLAYLPSITQAAELRQALDDAGYVLAETSELLRRTWHIAGRSVRPDHRMVAHTGFLTTARLPAHPGGNAPGGELSPAR